MQPMDGGIAGTPGRQRRLRPSGAGPGAALTATLFAALSTARAADSIDLEIRTPAQVTGTIQQTDERETFRLDLPAGATVKASTKARTKGAPATSLTFVDDADAVVAPGKLGKKGSKLAAPALAASGLYGLRVGGDGSLVGDYLLKVAVKPRTKWAGAGSDLAADGTATFTVAAPAGSVVKVDVRPAKGSPFAASIESLDGPGAPDPSITTGGASVTFTTVATGDHGVTFRNVGAAGGWTAKATVKPPKSKSAKFDVRDATLLGDPDAGQVVVGRVVGAAGGAIDAGAARPELAGIVLEVPAGAVTAPTTFTVGLGRDFYFGAPGHGVSVTVALGPSGAQFAQPVTVTLPFDPTDAGNPAADLTVYTQDDATLAVTAVPKPYDFTGPPNTVRFTTTHFSKFTAASTQPRGLQGDFVLVRARAALFAGFDGETAFALSELTIDPAGAWTGTATGVGSRFESDAGAGVPLAAAISETLPGDGTRTILSDTQVRFDFTGGPSLSMQRGASNGFLTRTEGTGALGGTHGLLHHSLFRRDPTAPTIQNVSGGWRFLRSARFAHPSAPGEVEFVTSNEQGRAQLRSNLDADLEMSGRAHRTSVTWPGAAVSTATGASAPVATWSVAGGDVLLQLGAAADPASVPKGVPKGPVFATSKTIRFVPILNGQAMVGLEDATGSDPGRALWFLVRDSTSAARTDLDGRARFDDLTSYFQNVAPNASWTFQYFGTSYDFDGAAGGTRDSCPSGFGIGWYGNGDPYVAGFSGPCDETSGDPPVAISWLHPADGAYLGAGIRGVWTRDAKVFFGQSDDFIRFVVGLRY